MKIKFTTPHLEYKIGDEIEVTDEQGSYFLRMGITEIAPLDESEPKKPGRPKKDN